MTFILQAVMSDHWLHIDEQTYSDYCTSQPSTTCIDWCCGNCLWDMQMKITQTHSHLGLGQHRISIQSQEAPG